MARCRTSAASEVVSRHPGWGVFRLGRAGFSSLRRHAVRFAAVGGAAAMVTAVLPVASSSAAQPTTVAAAQAQVDQLNDQAEVAAEQYDAAQARLDSAQQAAKAAEATVAAAHAKLAAQQAKVSALAASTYESGGMTPSVTVVMLSDGSPSESLTKLSLLQQIGRTQTATLVGMRAAGQRYQQALAAAAQADAAAKAISAQLAKQKQHIDALLAQSQRVLANLTAQQRAALQAAARAKAAAEQAQAAAALARAQAARPVSRSVVRPAPVPVVAAPPQSGSGASLAARAVAAAMTRLGDPYVWGAAGPNSFDCSGLVQWSYAQVGIHTAHYTGAFWSSYRHVPANQLQPGDLILFYPDHHHVGIYIGNGMMIHAPQTGDVVRIVSVASHGHYAGAVRVVG